MNLEIFEFELRKRGFIGNIQKGYTDGIHRVVLNESRTYWQIVSASNPSAIMDEGTIKSSYRILESIAWLRK